MKSVLVRSTPDRIRDHTDLTAKLNGWTDRPSAPESDVLETTLPNVYLFFHFFHLVQISSILSSNEMHAVGKPRWFGLGALLISYVLTASVAIRTRRLNERVALVPVVATAIFIVAVIPSMTAAAWALHGTWIGVVTADCLICYAILENRRNRIIGCVVFLLAFYGVAVWQIDPRVIRSSQFIATAGNYFAVTAALVGIASTIRSSLLAQAEAMAALSASQERNRFHRLIHDAALQPLEALAGGWDVDLADVRENARQQAVLLRAAIREDVGLDSLVLSDRIEALARQWTAKGLTVDTQLTAPNLLLAPTIVDALIGGAGEALANVLKHARTSSASLRSSMKSGQLHISVSDDGCGFEPTSCQEGIGITLSIRARIREVGGVVDVASSPGKGTVVTMSVPC